MTILHTCTMAQSQVHVDQVPLPESEWFCSLQQPAPALLFAVFQAGKVCLLTDKARSACQATVAQCRELSAKLQQLNELDPLLKAAEAQVQRESLDLRFPTHKALLIILRTGAGR